MKKNTTKPKRWKPKKGEFYFCIRQIWFPKSDPKKNISMWSYQGDATDRKFFQTGNMFRTENDAVRAYKVAAEAVSEIFLNLAEQEAEQKGAQQ